MKKISAILFLTFLVLANFDSAFAATQVKVKVRGLVCAFCAKNIEKSFMKKSEVEKVKTDLDTKIVTIDLKDDQKLSDEIIKDVVTNAGYNVVEIKR
ncbi:MAG: Heavy metal transport/detoxification protein [Rickettsiaceae bacterium]|jgi:mercuric ion binding protein|nr:Heavy metal transport/detoxification protein [Rickettsiaceae bacterium]